MDMFQTLALVLYVLGAIGFGIVVLAAHGLDPNHPDQAPQQVVALRAAILSLLWPGAVILAGVCLLSPTLALRIRRYIITGEM